MNYGENESNSQERQLTTNMEFCIGLIILIVVTVGGIWGYAYFASARANRERIAWTRMLDNIPLTELEAMRSELEKQKKTLQKDRLHLSGYQGKKLDVEINECNLRIKVLDTFIEE